MWFRKNINKRADVACYCGTNRRHHVSPPFSYTYIIS